jgi:hypothetical protein
MLDQRIEEFESSGGTLTDEEEVEVILDGLTGDAIRDAFWFNCVGYLNMLESAEITASSTRSYVIKFWNAHRSTGKISERHSANNAAQKRRGNRHCSACESKERLKIANSHDDALSLLTTMSI